MRLSTISVTSAVALWAVRAGETLSDFERVWNVQVRTVQTPVSASAQGTRMPIDRRQAEVKRHLVTAYVPSTDKQLATTGAVTGVIPGRTWSPPD